MKPSVIASKTKTDKTSTQNKDRNVIEPISTPVCPQIQDSKTFLSCDNRLGRIFELTSDGVVITQDGFIADCNQRFASMSGNRPERLIGTPLAKSLEIPSVSPPNGQDQGEVLRVTPAYLFGPDNQKIKVTVNREKMSWNGQASEIMFITKVAEPLETEADIQKTRKLESIAALSGGIAHDYNNLLTVIIGNISLIQSYMDSEDIIYRMLSEAYEASMIAKGLTQKLITFAKGGTPIKQTAALSPLIKSATEFTLSGSNIKCEFLIPDNLYLVEIDKTQISQAIHNLVMNAREAMPDGGIITVKAENVILPKKNHNLDAGKYVLISFADQGIGIAPDNLEKVFDPYFSTKQRGTQKGMGLGLSICHSIIERHSGDVKIKSNVGAGTTVIIRLPASSEKTIETKKATAARKEIPVRGRGRILVMDDERMIVKLTSLILHRLGYEAEFAAEGSEAIDMYAAAMKTDRPYDAVILDLTVRGGMGGKETIRNLIEMDPAVKGIVSSGYSDDPVMEDYQKYGFKGVVVKPFSIYELSENLNKVLTG